MGTFQWHYLLCLIFPCNLWECYNTTVKTCSFTQIMEYKWTLKMHIVKFFCSNLHFLWVFHFLLLFLVKYWIIYSLSTTGCQILAEQCLLHYDRPISMSFTWVYCMCHQVYCICNHLTSRANWVYTGCTILAIKCTAEAMLYFRSPTWVYCICHHVYCRDNHVKYIRSPT